ncbi:MULTISPECIES: (deoxy)nucleoside triphosphate pyrophosphohydrolase [Kurthia]|uniref:(deoxy)nucleoside triphosphate pyrophosphohydrolase n=1 Tax=Kurthia TaxID=1649 RepID=UPI0030CB8550
MKKHVHVVGAVMVNDEEKIFCAQRSKKMSLPGLWEFPGGKIEDGETKQQALIREIQEELACSIEVYEQIEDTTYEYETFVVRLETFKAKILKGEPVLQEHQASKWIAVEELDQLNWAAADVPAVKKIQKEFVR